MSGSRLYLAKDLFPADREVHWTWIRTVSCCFCPSSTPLLVQVCASFVLPFYDAVAAAGCHVNNLLLSRCTF